ncbi:hypothetical protein AVEN_51780-1, partial [Araneus ventricosus]
DQKNTRKTSSLEDRKKSTVSSHKCFQPDNSKQSLKINANSKKINSIAEQEGRRRSRHDCSSQDLTPRQSGI